MAPHADVDWPVCGQDGCIGIRLEEDHECLAHAGDEARDAALKHVAQTGRIDARGVTISDALLGKILGTVQHDADGHRTFSAVEFSRATFEGEAEFDEATFQGDAWFGGAVFQGDARFDEATFQGDARFFGATFQGDARFVEATFQGYTAFDGTFQRYAGFDRAVFQGDARFDEATFQGDAGLDGAVFRGYAGFDGATFQGYGGFGGARFQRGVGFGRVIFHSFARFGGAIFQSDARFGGAIFQGVAWFSGATFERAQQFGPLLAKAGLNLDAVQFAQPVRIEASTIGMSCCRARFPDGVQFRLRWASVVLDDADIPAPSLFMGIPRLADEELALAEQQMARDWEHEHAGPVPEQPRLLSLQRANVAGLGLANVDLADCRFSGAHNLDKLRLEADVTFKFSPARVGWEQRQVIAEECTWRASHTKPGRWADPWWPEDLEKPTALAPGAIAGLYRALRKSREDAKDEPGAADFYYGEMEMRRHARGQGDSGSRGRAERGVLTVYWLVSGYGLRAWRALAALVVLAVVITGALVGLGLAASASPQHLAGTITSSPDKRTRIDATLNTAQPELPPAGQRWTVQRTQTALEVTLDSIAFRATDQPLTTAGIWTTDAARILGPSLLVLALLAIRSRVKR